MGDLVERELRRDTAGISSIALQEAIEVEHLKASWSNESCGVGYSRKL